ncbi:MAG: hypothetical protein K8T26_09140 [Lentisphaerae bacterium]|nr:hypothetical protein [Lentisphaerota bacterium]
MLLNDAQIRAFALGVDRVDTLADGWRLHRMPSALEALYHANADAAARANCTTGVRLRFLTDSRHIRVTLRYGVPTRWYFAGAISIDRDRIDTFGPVSRQEVWSGLAFQQDERIPHQIDLWLPHLCGAEILRVDLEDGCRLEAAPRPVLDWVAYGDSITQGMNASLPVFAWPTRLARELDANVVNYGVGGATLRPELAQIPTGGTPKLISVSYGANDWNVDVPLKDFHQRAVALVDALCARHAQTPIVITTPVPFFRATRPNGQGATLDDFRAALEAAGSGRAQVHVVRGTDLVAADHNFFNDWSHPNDNGMREIAQNLLAALRTRGVLVQQA